MAVIRKIDCLVLMPIGSGKEHARWKVVFENILQPAIDAAIHKCGFEPHVWRIDVEPESGNWLGRIVAGLNAADLVVADLSGRNPNVMWELGMRHASARHGTIIVAQNRQEDVASDLTNYHFAEYREDAAGKAVFLAEMQKLVDKCLHHGKASDSPFFDHGGATPAMRHIAIQLELHGQRLGPPTGSVRFPKFEEMQPQITVNDLVNSRMNRSGQWDADAALQYRGRLLEAAPKYIALQQERWRRARIRNEAVLLRPHVFNHGPAEINDLEVRLAIRGGARFFQDDRDLPSGPELPQLPDPPKKPPSDSVGRMLLQAEQAVAAYASLGPSADVGLFRDIIAPKRQTGWVNIDGTAATFHLPRCRQEASAITREFVYFALLDRDQSAAIDIEVRSTSVAGVWRGSIVVRADPLPHEGLPAIQLDDP